jgi:hypothetical protein
MAEEDIDSKRVLFDANEKEIPECNKISNDMHLYIENEEVFNKMKDRADFNFKLGTGMAFMTTLFLWIFTLNFASNAWALGNLVTFLIMIISGVVTVYTVKEWNVSQNVLNQMVRDGSPCQKPNGKKGGATNVYCGYSSNTPLFSL